MHHYHLIVLHNGDIPQRKSLTELYLKSWEEDAKCHGLLKVAETHGADTRYCNVVHLHFRLSLVRFVFLWVYGGRCNREKGNPESVQ